MDVEGGRLNIGGGMMGVEGGRMDVEGVCQIQSRLKAHVGYQKMTVQVMGQEHLTSMLVW